MGTIGYGYGSEWHLLRYLGYHRKLLTQKTLELTGGNSIEWLDFKFANHHVPLKEDREFVGLEFLSDDAVLERWRSFWPQSGNAQNWDAVGKIDYGDRTEWVLVEAKPILGK